MKTEKVNIREVINGTSTAQQGEQLGYILETFLDEGTKVELSFRDTTPISSSFFQTSFGRLCAKYGTDFVVDHVIAVEIRPSHLKLIRYYFSYYGA